MRGATNETWRTEGRVNIGSESLVTVATYQDLHRAEMARNCLEAEDIPAFLSGAESASALSYVGTALGGVKVQVAKSLAGKAAQILAIFEQDLQSPIKGKPWVCADCGSTVDAGFEVCWSCGASFDSRAAELDEPPEEAESSGEADGPSMDQVAERAWRAAIFGIAFFPLAFYSLLLVFTLIGEPLSPQAKRKVYLAAAINTLVIISWGWLFRWITA